MTTPRIGQYPQFRGWPASEKLFTEPPEDFRPAAYWFWSREVDPNLFRKRLQQMKDAGIHGFWIQPRLGFPMEKYLSKEYFDYYRQALEIAREMAMYAGIYDDYNWITGHCAGRTVAGCDHFRESHIFWVEVPLSTGKPVGPIRLSNIRNMLTEGHREGMPWIYENGEYHFGEWEVIRAFSYRKGEEIDTSSVQDVTGLVEILEGGKANCLFGLKGECDHSATHLLVFAKARCNSSRMIDYLNPKAIERFIEVGYEPYYQELKAYWDMIWAMFIDEPYTGLYRWDEMQGDFGNAIMYNEDFLDQFATTKGYDIRDVLYSLVWPSGRMTAKWRCDFFEAYSKRVQESFFAPLRNWCDQHNVRLVGHELMTQLNCSWAFTTDSGFDVAVNFGADYFGMGAFKDTSTTDSGSYRKNISPKLASSIAHVLNKNGSMLEQYTPGFETDNPNAPGARGDWNISIETVKKQMDYYAIQGLSQFLWHGFFQSNDVTKENTALYSQRFDFPPGLNFEPWYRYFKRLSDRNGRLAYFLSIGRHVAPAVVLYPLRTYWSKGRTDLFAKEGAFLHESLARLHYDYDFIDERNLEEASLRDGRLQIADEEYSILVLQAVSTLAGASIVSKLEEFVLAGGVLVISGRLPNETQENGYDKEVKERLLKLVAENKNVLYFEEPLFSTKNGHRLLAGGLDQFGLSPVSITTNGHEDLGSFACLRDDQDAKYLAVLNDEGVKKPVRIVLRNCHGVPELWDVDSGEITEWLSFSQDGSDLIIDDVLDSFEVRCFRIRRETTGPSVLVSGGRLIDSRKEGNSLELTLEMETNQDGALEIDGFRCSSLKVWENGSEASVSVKRDAEITRIEFPSRDISPELLLKTDWELSTEDGQVFAVSSCSGWENQGLATYSGGAWYRQKVDVPLDLAKENVMLEIDQVYHTVEVVVNGKHCGTRPWRPFTVDITDALNVGENVIELLVTNTAGNQMYHGTHYDVNRKAPSGIIGAVRLKPCRLVRVEAE